MANLKLCQAIIHVLERSKKVCTAIIHVVPPPRQIVYTVLRNSEENGFGGLGLPTGYVIASWNHPSNSTIEKRGRLLVFTPATDFYGSQNISATATAYNKPDIEIDVTVNVIRRDLSVTFANQFVLQNSQNNTLALSHADMGEGKRIVAASVDIGGVVLTDEGVEYTPPAGYIGPAATITYSVSNEQGD